MKTNNLTTDCKGCGGSLVYNPSSQSLLCQKCGGLTEINKDVNYERHSNTNLKINEEIQTKNCPNCGAILTHEELEVGKKCAYCNSDILLNFTTTPDAVIPFAFNKQKAIEYYNKHVKKRWFLPNNFKKNPKFSSMEGCYIPSFALNCKTHSTYSGRLATTHSDSKGNTYTTYRNISGSIDLDFDNTFIESSSKLTQSEITTILPFKINEENPAYKFDSGFIRGYSVENNNTTLAEVYNTHDTLIKSKIKSHILSRYHYDRVCSFNLDAEIFDITYSYILLPVYEINIKYKDKDYKTFLNGETGKLGSNLPKSGWKIAGFIIMLVLIFFGVPLLIHLLQ